MYYTTYNIFTIVTSFVLLPVMVKVVKTHARETQVDHSFYLKTGGTIDYYDYN